MAKQVKMTLENERGEGETIYPVNTSDDVVVGKLVAGELALPGNSMDEMLKTTLENIRKFLANMQDIAATKRVVTDTIADAANTDIPSVKALDSISDDLRSISLSVNTLLNEIENRAFTSHAVDDGSNGIGTNSLYGHVKVASSLADVEDKNGVALGVDVGENLQNQINGKAATSHTSDTGENGKASTETYGHVKLSNDYSEEMEDDGVAASQTALCSLYRNVGNQLIDVETELTGKAAKNHANSDKSVIGGATASIYGHVKLSDNYSSSAGNAASSIGASSLAVYNCYNNRAPKSHASTATTYGAATASNYGHVKLSDSYTSNGGAASSAVGASSQAVYNCYVNLNNKITSLQNEAYTQYGSAVEHVINPNKVTSTNYEVGNYILTKMKSTTSPGSSECKGSGGTLFNSPIISSNGQYVSTSQASTNIRLPGNIGYAVLNKMQKLSGFEVIETTSDGNWYHHDVDSSYIYIYAGYVNGDGIFFDSHYSRGSYRCCHVTNSGLAIATNSTSWSIGYGNYLSIFIPTYGTISGVNRMDPATCTYRLPLSSIA